MGLFQISRELQLRVCNHVEPRASPGTAREGDCFYIEEKEAGRATGNKETVAFHCLSPCQERRVFPLPVGLCYHHKV